MYDTEYLVNAMTGSLAGGLLTGAVLGTILLIAFVVFAVFWVYTSLAWIEIGRKLRYRKTWLAWIPFARSAMIFEMGGFNWQWAFLWLIPVLGWIAIFVLSIISSWKIFEKRNYPGWFALAAVFSFAGGQIGSLFSIANLVILGFVAWKDLKKPLFQ